MSNGFSHHLEVEGVKLDAEWCGRLSAST